MELNVTLPKEHDNRTPPMGAKLPNFRWLQLSIGIVCMVMIANLQYGWTLFVNGSTKNSIGGARRSKWLSRSSS